MPGGPHSKRDSAWHVREQRLLAHGQVNAASVVLPALWRLADCISNFEPAQVHSSRSQNILVLSR